MQGRLIVVLFLLLPGFSGLLAQNLVPNPGFEDFKTLPCSWNISVDAFPEYVSSWYVPSGTSTDIHSTLVDENCWANPSNPNSTEDCKPGVQLPRTGNVMAGLYTVVNTHLWHEYLQIKLSMPLIPGQRYCIQMYVSPADHATNTSNNIGMFFSPDPVSGKESIIAQPQINSEETITDTEGWTLISGSYIAETAAEYLTIGNFFTDEETQQTPIINGPGCTDGAYFYIDDIS
ncbi:MAG: hypothetical protein ACXWW0_13580, partial [Bacteroidia bacterium]